MTLTSAALVASMTGYSGCVLGTHLVPDDADLAPFTPVAFAETLAGPDGTHTVPRPPNSVIIVDNLQSSIVFDVTVLSDSRRELQANWFVDRQRPCTRLEGNCGEFIPLQITEVPVTAGLRRRIPIFEYRNLREGHCTAVDLYVAESFQVPTESQNLPIRAGEVSFARWFVVRRDALGGLPSLDDCVHEVTP